VRGNLREREIKRTRQLSWSSFKVEEDKKSFLESEKEVYEITRKLRIKARDSARRRKRERKVLESARERACVKETAGEIEREEIVRQREIVGAGECVKV